MLGKHSCHDNICISNAQYCELGARGNLWCEIFELWEVEAMLFVYSVLGGWWVADVNHGCVKVAVLVGYSGTVAV